MGEKKHEFDDSVPRIYEEVMGKEFDDPEWIHNDSFGKDEWDILKSVCERLFPNEELAFEMMYSMIDIENNASNVNLRKGILDSLSSTIGKTFYKNEEDATAYYTAQMVRKKENGGKYNEKFLENKTNVSEYEDSEEEDS